MALTRDEFFDDDFAMDFGSLPGSISNAGQELFPVDALSNQELAELAALKQRSARLQPLDFGDPVSNNRIRGNPYSINTAPIINAVKQGLEGTVNAIRQRRMLRPDEEAKVMLQGAKEIRERANELKGEERKKLLQEADKIEQSAWATTPKARLEALTKKSEVAESQQERQAEFMQELFPELAGKLFDARSGLEEIYARGEQARATLQDKYGFDVGLNNVKYATDLAILDKELDNSLAEIAAKAQAEGGAGGNEITGQDINNLRQVMVPMLQRIKQQEREIAGNYNLSQAERDQKTAELNEQYDKILNTVFTKAAAATNFSEEEINALLKMTDEQAKGQPIPGVGEGTVLDPNAGVKTSFDWNSDILGNQ